MKPTTVASPATIAETFTPDETRALAPYFTNADRPVVVLTNLPETVKGALFARYSRSAKSVRRLFLDEFLGQIDAGASTRHMDSGRVNDGVGLERADKLYARVLNEYGDDSVAQLGGAHIACEGVSNVLTKVLEWGRLMAYLEQSTRYVPYTDRPGGRWKYHVPAELDGSPLRETFVRTLDHRLRHLRPVDSGDGDAFPRAGIRSRPSDSDGVYKSVIRAKALDTLRGLLPAATTSNVGLFGDAARHSKPCSCGCSHTLSRKSATVRRADADRAATCDSGVSRASRSTGPRRPLDGLLRRTRDATSTRWRVRSSTKRSPSRADEVTLTDFDPEGETKVVAAALYSIAVLPDDQLLAIARRMSRRRSCGLLRAYAGTRANRRHKPGRAFERTSYRFDVLADYGAFRDLQRHRLLTLEWQPLSTRHGYTEPAAIEDAGALADWRAVMSQSADLLRAVDRGRAARRRAVRGGHGVPRPLLHGHERARGDARHRAADVAAGPSVVSPRLSADAPRDRRRRGTSRDRRRDAVRGSLGGGARTSAVGAQLEKKALGR